MVDRLAGDVVVAHDSLLPRFRGFAPLATAMITGEKETGVTYLRVGDSVDNGDILWQARVPIGNDDTIQSLIDKLSPLYARGAHLYFSESFNDAQPQDDSKATFSIWRDSTDYRIDWTHDADIIERTVRALGPPYLGAQTTVDGTTIVISRASVQPDVKFAIRQPGKVWSIDELGRPSVVCGTGVLRIDQAAQEGKSLLPFRKLRVRFE